LEQVALSPQGEEETDDSEGEVPSGYLRDEKLARLRAVVMVAVVAGRRKGRRGR